MGANVWPFFEKIFLFVRVLVMEDLIYEPHTCTDKVSRLSCQRGSYFTRIFILVEDILQYYHLKNK